jgi:hypothetical protein
MLYYYITPLIISYRNFVKEGLIPTLCLLSFSPLYCDTRADIENIFTSLNNIFFINLVTGRGGP